MTADDYSCRTATYSKCLETIQILHKYKRTDACSFKQCQVAFNNRNNMTINVSSNDADVDWVAATDQREHNNTALSYIDARS